MKWVTRERPKIDRIACPWLIERFIDRDAEFLFVAPDDVARVARETGAVPFDVEGVELSHDGPLCSFDAFLDKYQLRDPSLAELARIVRGADTDRLDTAPQCADRLDEPWQQSLQRGRYAYRNVRCACYTGAMRNSNRLRQ